MSSNFKKFLGRVSALSMAMSFTVSSPVFAARKNSDLKETTIFVAGDSTACNYGYDEAYAIPRAGWGMCLSDWLDDRAKVVNLALGGRSSKSFTVEENYQILKDSLKEGDFLLIQFGHNDEKNTKEEDVKNRYTDPEGDKETEGSFKYYLYENYIKLAQEKGATPILISPVSRRKFDKDNKITDSHGLYDDAVRELAEETGVDFIDMTKITEEEYNKSGPELTKLLHAAYIDKTKATDNTHFNYLGASAMAFNILDKSDNLGKYKLDFNSTTKYITRGEFIEAVMRAIGETKEISDENFKDVPDSYEYADSIALAKKAGIAVGDNLGNFKPNENIAGYDACVFAMRALRYKGVDYPRSSDVLKFSLPKYAIQDVTDLLNLFKINSEYLEYYDWEDFYYFENQCISDKLDLKLKDFFTVPIYEMILNKENAQIQEQDLNELEKVE